MHREMISGAWSEIIELRFVELKMQNYRRIWIIDFMNSNRSVIWGVSISRPFKFQ